MKSKYLSRFRITHFTPTSMYDTVISQRKQQAGQRREASSPATATLNACRSIYRRALSGVIGIAFDADKSTWKSVTISTISSMLINITNASFALIINSRRVPTPADDFAAVTARQTFLFMNGTQHLQPSQMRATSGHQQLRIAVPR